MFRSVYTSGMPRPVPGGRGAPPPRRDTGGSRENHSPTGLEIAPASDGFTMSYHREIDVRITIRARKIKYRLER